MYFIGPSARIKLRQVIVDTTTRINIQVWFTPPIPTARPPRIPTIINIAEIIPKRLNSAFWTHAGEDPFVFSIVFYFLLRQIWGIFTSSIMI